MALDSTRAPFYAFGSPSSSSAHQFLHMMQGGGTSNGKVLSDSNDGSLISFEESYEAVQNSNTRQRAECFNNSHQTATSLDSRALLKGKVSNGDELSEMFYSSDAAEDHQNTLTRKHHNTDESYMPPSKKQCMNKKSKLAKTVQPSKDPQSIAAKNRRERISERLRILQELVPNGTKVDLVTMLEKAIGYVKFLQLQVKVLAADEFWPVQGGKAPELSQVKDAIDAILSSQRSDRNSASD